jgi:hypothetical protein
MAKYASNGSYRWPTPASYVLKTASLAVSTIGLGVALAHGRTAKHAIKQVDRLLSNPGIDVDAVLQYWVPYVVGSCDSINARAVQR